MSGIVYLEDGSIYKGTGFGAIGTTVGEIVFNTSMIGYDEVLVDNSSAGQIVVMTYPIIGNYGVDKSELNMNGLSANGLVIKDLCEIPSNYQSEISLDEFSKDMNIVGVTDIDTRSLTKKIRTLGSTKCVISNEEISETELKDLLEKTELREDYIKDCIVEKKHIEGRGVKIATLDFGGTNKAIDILADKDCDITVFPYGTTYEEIKEINPDGLFVGSGPGNPKFAKDAIGVIEGFIKDKTPIFGIDLGHQLIALALGAETEKMKFGHRGGNHGIKDLEKDQSYIVTQNHGFVVSADSLGNDLEITHINLNDDTVEGIGHKTLPVFSVQFHPEAECSYKYSEKLFDKFIDNCKEGK